MTRMEVVTAAFAATLFAGSVMAADLAPSCSEWNAVATPTNGKVSELRSVDAFGASNVWVVGHAWDPAGTRDGAPVAMRFDGSAWTAEPLPDLAHLGVQPEFESVGLAPTGDPWVVGHLRDANGARNVPLVLRSIGGFWEAHNITMLNSFVPRYPLVRDVVAIAENNAWVVGEAQTEIKGALEPFAAHWDGIAWSEVAFPGTVDGQRVVTAVSGAAADAVWAVGHDIDPTTEDAPYARIYRFDGREWSIVEHPVATRAGSVLHDIAVLAANDVWAVGTLGTSGVLLHWDGSTWKLHEIANADLRSVDGAASGDAWVAGASGYYHWDGTSWSVPASSGPDTIARRAVAVAGPCEAWSISSRDDANGKSSLVERLGPSGPVQERPSTPLGFTATPKTSRSIVLEWLPGGDRTGSVTQTGFVIERCIGAAGDCQTRFTMIRKVGGGVTSYGDSGLTPATAYTYRIYAVDDAGQQSEPTTPATAVTLTEDGPSALPVPSGDRRETRPAQPGGRLPQQRSAPTTVTEPLPPYRPAPPATPKAFVATAAGSRDIVLEWAFEGDPMGAAGQLGFAIERCVGQAGECVTRFTIVGKANGQTRSFVDSELRPATYYTYRIYAVNEAGQSEPTAPETALTFPGDASSPDAAGPAAGPRS